LSVVDDHPSSIFPYQFQVLSDRGNAAATRAVSIGDDKRTIPLSCITAQSPRQAPRVMMGEKRQGGAQVSRQFGTLPRRGIDGRINIESVITATAQSE